ncbi:MAG: dihydrofolate reductase, partial [Patescibacteria group bacterium]|nr:dihydrofolate reductase [Patescibacteria group bacterium]
DLADVIIASEINATILECTVFFPKIDKNVWREVSRQHMPANKDNLYDFDIVTYKKIKTT